VRHAHVCDVESHSICPQQSDELTHAALELAQHTAVIGDGWHTSAPQHSADCAHVSPTVLHDDAPPHTPLTHADVQHSPSYTQLCPSARHWHVPPEHSICPQQSLDPPGHVPPEPTQHCVTDGVPWHNSAPQHSLEVAQLVSCSALHPPGLRHVPLMHRSAPQHSPSYTQLCPSARHWHVPPEHNICPQQSLAPPGQLPDAPTQHCCTDGVP
jgi:hypothetical protein